jgi:hypothetical protein
LACQWGYVPAASFLEGPASVAQAIRDEEAWVAIVSGLIDFADIRGA